MGSGFKAWCALVSTATVASFAADSRACGGTFCDSGPQAMPVDQTGENVLFVLGDGIVEAHVQIQYQGDPERFAWIVPMQGSGIKVSVGSQALFDAVLQATVPSYGFTTQRDQCSSSTSFARGNADQAGFGAAGSFAPEDEGVDVLLRDSVGSFDVAIISAESADDIVSWLADENFQNIDTAPEILQRYIDKRFVFAAIKLQAGAGVEEIHPLTFTYSGGEPCVPLELTAVAAVEDMGVRTFFLGESRVVPGNYRHVVVNPLRIDWPNFGANYTDVISEAVDVEHADGRAFVTEYAGPSNVVSRSFVNSQWDASRFEDIAPGLVLDEMNAQGLAYCGGGYCEYNHPLALPILQEFLKRPTGVPEEDFYSCVACYGEQFDATQWNPQAFALALNERIIEPARHAEQILASHPYLTRLFTLISPYEMTVDPMFQENPELADVPLPTFANQRILCNGRSIFQLPDGRQVALDENGQWPAFDGMPAAEQVEEFVLSGPPTILASNTAAIQQQLSSHNASRGLGSDAGCDCSVPGMGRTPSAGFLIVGLGLLGAGLRRRDRR